MGMRQNQATTHKMTMMTLLSADNQTDFSNNEKSAHSTEHVTQDSMKL